MICVNELSQLKCSKRSVLEPLIVCLAPFTPHICEELWSVLGHDTTICDAAWPQYNEEYIKEDTVNYTVSFNGKARFNKEFAVDAQNDEIEKEVLADERSARWTEGKQVIKVIVVPRKIVNIVVK